MKTSRIAAAAILAAALATPSIAQVKSYTELKFEPLRKINIPQPKRVELSNGMVILLEEDHQLPLIRGTVNVRGGQRNLPANKAGLATIYGSAWRTGGTESKTGDQLDDLLEARGARIETRADDDSSAITIDVLKGDFDSVFPLMVELLQKPAFRQDKIDLAKTQVRSAISRRNDDPGTIARREARKLAYGSDSPYAAQAEYETVNAITRDDLVAFHKRFAHPNNMIVGLVGDFDAAAMEKKLRAAFGSLPRGEKAPVAPPAGKQAAPGIYFVSKPDVNQTTLAILEQGAPLRSDPDYYAIDVMNTILSGVFSGRLMNHIRTQQGLAYGVSGGIVTNWDYPGLIAANMATKSGSTVQAIKSLQSEFNDLITKPFTDEELKQAKDALLNAFVFTADSPRRVLEQAVMLEFYGYPADYWTRYPANVEKVTAEDVARVAKKYVKPEQLSVLVVGNPKEFDQPLTTLGKVVDVDITIPEPGAKPAAPAAGAAAAPAATTADAKPFVAKMQEFFGGKAKLDALQATRKVTNATMKTPQGDIEMEIEEVRRYPDTYRQTMKTPMGDMVTVVSPDAAFMQTPMGTQDLPASMRNEGKLDALTVLKNAGAYTFAVTGTEKVGDVNATVLTVSIDGASTRWLIDPATGKLLRTVRQGRMGEQITEFGDWKVFNGINMPSTFSMTVNGEKSGSGTMKTMDVNPAVDASLFTKPVAK